MSYIKLTLSYDGTNYSGFQRQQNALSIQEVLERTLSKIYNETIKVTGSSRTDAGVHARGQVINYLAPFHIKTERIPHALNSVLPEDIRVIKSDAVSPDFHARFDAKSKLYTYTIDKGKVHSVFQRFYTWHIPYPLNVSEMQEASRYLLGRHDFTSFCASGSSIKNKVREITQAYWLEEDNILRFYIQSDGYLYKMARIIVGTIVETGRGRIKPGKIVQILEEKNRSLAGPTAPARGLCLERVFFENNKH